MSRGKPTLDERCRKEVEELHRFFVDWLTGEAPAGDDGLRRVRDVLHPDFEIITPAGEVLGRSFLLEQLRKSHGSRGSVPDFTIRVDGYVGRTLEAGFHLARYQEWQKEEGGLRGRLSSAVFRRRPGTPNGVEWLHLHEVWLP